MFVAGGKSILLTWLSGAESDRINFIADKFVSNSRDDLVSILENTPNDSSIAERVSALEQSQQVDLSRDSALLQGVWDLRWSSSSQPWLRQAPWLENLQVLDPSQSRGCNLLRLRGPLGTIGAISVQAELKVIDQKRVEVKFRKGGWLGPSLPGIGQVKLLREVQQSFPAWLDITFLDEQLRICRGNAGTIFALLRQERINIVDLI